jgi:hypothetical protein
MSGVSLRDTLGLPALRNARVLAGAAGLGHSVRYVNVTLEVGMHVRGLIARVVP